MRKEEHSKKSGSLYRFVGLHMRNWRARKRQYRCDLGRKASQGFCSTINLFTLLSTF